MEGELLNLITRKNLCKETKDALVWHGDRNGVFFCEICLSEYV